MIYDTLNNAGIYYPVHPLFKEAFTFLRNFDPSSYTESTRIRLIDEELRAGIDIYRTTSAESKKWEAHRKYIDIQCVYRGHELFGAAPVDDLAITDEYNPQKDVLYLKEKPQSRTMFGDLFPGRFAVFFPGDAHKPGVHTDNMREEEILKVVIKIIIK